MAMINHKAELFKFDNLSLRITRSRNGSRQFSNENAAVYSAYIGGRYEILFCGVVKERNCKTYCNIL